MARGLSALRRLAAFLSFDELFVPAFTCPALAGRAAASVMVK
jgi:hypothetical protein